jgi:hypothetical protein
MRDDVQIFVETWGRRFTLPMGSLSCTRSEQRQVLGPYGQEHAEERVTKAETHV